MMLRQRLFVMWLGCKVAPLAPPRRKRTRSPSSKINEISYTLFTLANSSTHVNRPDNFNYYRIKGRFRSIQMHRGDIIKLFESFFTYGRGVSPVA